MNRVALIADRLRLRTEIGLHRHGPWWPLLALAFCLLLGLSLILMPALRNELAANEAVLGELRVRVASGAQPVAAVESASARHYQAFRRTLAEEGQVLPSIQAVLDSAARHGLSSKHAEYLRGRDLRAQAETVQMIVPVKGRYADVRRWIEELLATQVFLAVNELGFKRDAIGVNEIEARVRLTIWHHPSQPAGRAAGEVDAEGG
ncbi:MAG: hypothetical protein KDI45_04110 [Candidatus Accumulibacter sp.]|nr:hypothetical protein [Accumulibacter sp.]